MFTILIASTRRALRDRKGVSASEYVLMVVGMAAAVALGASLLGTDLSNSLSTVGTYINNKAIAVK